MNSSWAKLKTSKAVDVVLVNSFHSDVFVISFYRNSISASAICAFNLSSITQAFNGPFRYQENPRTAWFSTSNPIPNFQVSNTNVNTDKIKISHVCFYSYNMALEVEFLVSSPSSSHLKCNHQCYWLSLCLVCVPRFSLMLKSNLQTRKQVTSWHPPSWLQCGTLEEGGTGRNLTERSLQDAQRLFLMNDVVQPVTVNPLLTQDNLRFSKMVVDIVQGRNTLYHVMYIGTGEQERRLTGSFMIINYSFSRWLSCYIISHYPIRIRHYPQGSFHN